MDAADMFDVIHVLYEQDVTPTWEHDIDAKDSVRTALYETVYKRKYMFATEKSRSAAGTTYGLDPNEDLGSIPELPDIPEAERERKAYIPPTDPADLPFILDPPVN